MRIDILTESSENLESLDQSPFDISVVFRVKLPEYLQLDKVDSRVSRDYIKTLSMDKVAKVVYLSKPYIAVFFRAVMDRKYEDVLDVLYPVVSTLVSRYSPRSPVIDEFKDVLSIGEVYGENVESLLSFYKTLDSESVVTVSKVKAIYDRFKNNSGRLLGPVFNAYEQYMETLKDGQETHKSRKSRQSLYSIYTKDQEQLESLINEMASLRSKDITESPLKSISSRNYDLVSEFFETNRSGMKKLASKLLYLAYLEEQLINEQGSLYSSNKHSKFINKTDSREVLDRIKRELLSKLDYQAQVTVKGDIIGISFKSISSIDFKELCSIIESNASSGSVSIKLINMAQEFSSIPHYLFYYALDKAFGSKALSIKASQLLDIESPTNAATILLNSPMPDNFDYKEHCFTIEGSSIKFKSFSISELKNLLKYVEVFGIIKDCDLNAYSTELSKIVDNLIKNPESVLSSLDLIKHMRKRRDSELSSVTFNVLRKSLNDKDVAYDISYVVSYVMYYNIINEIEYNKLFRSLFAKVLKKYGNEVVQYLIGKCKSDESNLAKVKDHLIRYGVNFEDTLNGEVDKNVKSV